MRAIKVDVIIAVYNAESTIEEAVGSALHQEIPDHLINDLSGCHFDICICCYDDASTDKSLDKLQSLEKERMWRYPSSQKLGDEKIRYDATMQTKLLIGTAPIGTTSRGAGYARNQAVKLRDEYEQNANKANEQGEECSHFLCILDSDDIMHPTRIAEQTSAMLSLSNDNDGHQKTLMGCQFTRIPKDSTQHYSQWANSLSDERLYLEQFRECTLLQPTWFLSKAWFECLGGYLEAPASNTATKPKRAKIDTVSKEEESDVEDSTGNDAENKQFYRLIHPSEINPAITQDAKVHEKRKTDAQETSTPTLRLAEDTRFFYAQLHAGGRLHLHRTSSPLVSYRHRSGMSQSSNTPRKLLLKLRAKAWEDLIYRRNKGANWTNGFAIWGAGRDGKDFFKALSPEVASKVVCFVDVDEKKIEKIKWYDNPALAVRRIPILHFSVLSKSDDMSSDQVKFGRIDKKCGKHDFDIISQHGVQLKEYTRNETPSLSLTKSTNNKMDKKSSIDPEILQQLPVVVCVAMYRTNGALERNVASIGRVEGDNLWHII